MRRLNRMFGAISATNEAILRAKTEQELYQRVCDAAVHSGKSLATVVLLAEPDSIWLKPVAGTGESLDLHHADALLDRPGQCLWPAALPARRSGPRSLASTTISPPTGGAVAAGRTRDRRRRLRRRAADQGRQEHRRPDVLCQQVLGGGRGDRRAAGADRGERLVRARQFRARGRKGEGRRAEGAPDAHVRGAERDQRSDHAGQVASRAVRTGLRGGGPGRTGSTRPASLLVRPDSRLLRYRRRCRADRGQCPQSQSLDHATRFRKGAASAGPRSARGRPASATTFCRRSASAALRQVNATPQGSKVGRGVSAAGRWRQPRRRHALHLVRNADTFTPEFVELLQRLADNVSFALGELRSRRREGEGRGAEGAADAACSRR